MFSNRRSAMKRASLATALTGVVVSGLLWFLPRASATSGFGVGDFKGTYVATFQGSFYPDNPPFFGSVYLSADGNGGVTCLWEIQTPGGTTNGDLTGLRTTYTVTPDGRVSITAPSTSTSNILYINVFLAEGTRAILGRGGFYLGGGAVGVGMVRGSLQ
jgi:hypothetical protein